jgi:hypothetical protein
MTNSPSVNAPTTIPVRSPVDLLALVPYLIGFHPSASLCVVGMKESAVTCALRYDLPDSDRLEEFSSSLAPMIAGKPVEVVVLAGYGPEQDVTPVMNAAREAMATAGVRVADALRADQGRYWSYVCGNDACCPPEGTTYNASTSAAAAAAVMCGMTALPDRGELAASITPEDGPSRRAMEDATRRAAEQIEKQMRGPGGARGFILEIRQLITNALDTHRNGERLGVDDVARLSVLLGSIRLRDEAWVTIKPGDLETQLMLWSDLTRRATVNASACASLLAFTAWLDGNGALANIAVDRALEADSGYSMARLMGDLLAVGLPPGAAGILPTAEELAAMDLAAGDDADESAGSE